MWDVTCANNAFRCAIVFLLTHPVWDVTTWEIPDLYVPLISTHTSRVGCDLDIPSLWDVLGISTHTSRVGCDRVLLGHPYQD